MTRRLDTPPDFASPDSGLALVGYWRVEPGSEDAVADAIASTWGARELPTFGLVSYTLLLGTGSVLHFTQLARIDTRPDFEVQASYTAEITERIPGIEVLDVTAARPYRTSARLPDAPRPGWFGLMTIMLESPCPGGQEQWIDTVLDRTDIVPPPESGLIAAHFFSTTDCTRVLILGEWTTAEARHGSPVLDDPRLREVPNAPTVIDVFSDEYRFAFTLLPR